MLSSSRPLRLYSPSGPQRQNRKKLAASYVQALQSQSRNSCVEDDNVDVRVLGRRRLNELSPLKVYDGTDIGEIDMGGLWLK